MKRILVGGFLVVLLLLLFRFGSPGKVAAVVNGQVITAAELDGRMSRLSPQARAAIGNDRRRITEEMVMETILVQEARRRGLEGDPQVQSLLKEARRQILLGRLLEIVRQEGAANIGDAEISQFYEKNKDKFVEPETFRASHILVESEEAAKKALSQVNGGEPFAKVAEQTSTDPSKTRGGDVGYFKKGDLIPEFEAACEKLKPGEMSSIVKSPLGYHLILLTEHRVARSLSLDEVRDNIRQQLLAQQQQQKVGTFVQHLRAKAQVKIHESVALPALPSSTKPIPPAVSPKPAKP
ncbi:MAG: peptidylprolyl isomerase [Candidatus Omnitrophica bacterium]|nr:peptidylprolyl isomerase [Candidatus Omnitrophota bacterium]